MMLWAVNLFSRKLWDRHLAWKERLPQARPGASESELLSQAMETAMKEMEGSLASVFLPKGCEELSLDEQ
jgi:hypothetical protein